MGELFFENEVYTTVDFSGGGFPIGDYADCRFQNCDFSGCDFSSGKFFNCFFVGCNLSLVRELGVLLRHLGSDPFF